MGEIKLYPNLYRGNCIAETALVPESLESVWGKEGFPLSIWHSRRLRG